MIPTLQNYCENTTPSNALKVDLGPVQLWYSYRTIVAFRAGTDAPTVSRNEWGPTTGKHLNAIDGGDKDARLHRSAFKQSLRDTLGRFLPDAQATTPTP